MVQQWIMIKYFMTDIIPTKYSLHKYYLSIMIDKIASVCHSH